MLADRGGQAQSPLGHRATDVPDTQARLRPVLRRQGCCEAVAPQQPRRIPGPAPLANQRCCSPNRAKLPPSQPPQQAAARSAWGAPWAMALHRTCSHPRGIRSRTGAGLRPANATTVLEHERDMHSHPTGSWGPARQAEAPLPAQAGHRQLETARLAQKFSKNFF